MTSQLTVYESTTTYSAIAARIHQARRIVLTTHRKPDGDAIGSVVGLYRGLKSIGKDVEIFITGPLDHSLRLICGDTPVSILEEEGFPQFEPDLIILADTGAWSQLEAIEHWLRDRSSRIVGLDHHANGDDVASERVVDTTAAACTQLVMALFKEMEIDLGSGSGSVAEVLFVGMGTDTGWFRFSNADARCFADASHLLEHGFDRYNIYRTLEETARPARMALLQRMLASIEYVGPVAIMYLRSSDFRETKGTSTDIVGLVNTPMVLESIQASVLLTDSDPSVTKMSFRSKPSLPHEPHSLIDVNQLAGNFGGGGHVHASGARVFSPLDEVRTKLVQLLKDF